MTRLHLPQTRTHHRNQQEVKGQEVQPSDSVMLREAMQLRPSAVVDVHVLLLSRSKHELVVQVPVGEGEGSQPHPLWAGQGTHLTSLTVSWTWNSQPSFLVDQSNVERWPLRPPINRNLWAVDSHSWVGQGAGHTLYTPSVSGVVDRIGSKGV